MLGNERMALGWFRDARCVPPEWPVRRLAGQAVKLDLAIGRWTVEFFDPISGKSLGNRDVASNGNRIALEIPEFEDAIAFKLRADDR